MKLYFRILKFIKPYRFAVIASLLSSLLYVTMNAFSLWMVSSLISTIMMPSKASADTLHVGKLSILEKMEEFANYLIGSGGQLEQLKMLCLLLFVSYVFKNIFFFLNNVSLSFVQNNRYLG